MTRAAVEKVAWGFGGVVLVLALAFPLADRPADPGLWMASLGYLIGFHWIVAFVFGRPMYGAMRLQPTQRASRTVIFVLGVALVVVALQFLLGFGGLFA
jgi:hypothetical protein